MSEIGTMFTIIKNQVPSERKKLTIIEGSFLLKSRYVSNFFLSTDCQTVLKIAPVREIVN